MKNLLFIGFLVIMACGKSTQQDNPEQAIKGFFEAVNNADFDLAKHYTTKRTYQQLRELEASFKMSSENEKKQLKNNLSDVHCEDQSGQIVCTACCTPDGAKASLKMLQENNKWFVDFEIDL